MAACTTRQTARRRNRRRWRAATFLTPTVLMVAASSALLSMPPPTLRDGRADGAPGGSRYGATGHLPRNLEPSENLLDLAGEPRKLPGPAADLPRGSLDIPEPMLAAYVGAADRLGQSYPACGVRWSVLAAIGRIESGHARDGRIDVNGTTVPAILGPRLSGGPGVAAIPDTDQGSLDGDPVWDRAVGSMQLIPSTWNKHAMDGNDDGVLSPHNVHDAVASAGAYLCDGDADLRDPRQLAEAVFRYNHSDDYVRTVLRWASAYDSGVTPSPLEPLPDVGDQDVLAGSRLPNDRPHAVALPHSASEPVAPARPGWSAVTPPPGSPDGHSGEPIPGPRPGSAAGEPAQPSDPHASNSAVPPSANTPPAPEPSGEPVPGTGSSVPGWPEEPAAPGISSEQPLPGFPSEPSMPVLTGDPETPSDPSVPSEPATPSGPSEPATPAPSGEPSATDVPPAPSSTDPVPPSSVGPSSDPAAPSETSTVPQRPSAQLPSSQGSQPPTPSTTPTTDGPVAPSSTAGPQRPETSEPTGGSEASALSTSADPADRECDAATLREGRFVPAEQLSATGRALPAGTTDAGEASPGDIVYVQSGGSGPLDPCEVPADFAP